MTKRLFTTLVNCLWILSSLPLLLSELSLSANADDSANLYSKTKEGVVKLEINELGVEVLSGTGFFISADGWIATNRHVFEEATTPGHGLRVSTQAGFKTTQFQVGGCSEEIDLDLCLFKVEFKPKYFFALTPNPPEQVGEKVYVIGHPLGLNYSMTDGVLSGLRETRKSETLDRGSAADRTNPVPVKTIQISASISHGNSGGPIFDAQGQLLGIATFNRGGGQNLNFGMDAAEVYRFAKTHLKPIKIEDYQKLTSAQYTKFYQALETVFNEKLVKLKAFKLGKIEAELPDFIAKTCKLSFEKKMDMAACADPLADGSVVFGATLDACTPEKFPLFQDCIRTRIARDIDKPTPVKALKFLIQKAHGAAVPSPGPYAFSKPGPLNCHWDGDHEICSIKIENDGSPGSLGLWSFYRHKTLPITVFTLVIYKRAEAENYAQKVSHVLIDKLASSMSGIVKEVQLSKTYHIHGIVLSPHVERPESKPPYLEFTLRSDLGGTYTAQDFVYPFLRFKRGKELHAGSEYDYHGKVIPDPSHMTKGFLKMTNPKHYPKNILMPHKG